MIPLVGATAVLPWLANDPAPNFTRTKAASRELECERSTVDAAVRARPGEIAPPPPRSNLTRDGALICVERVLRHGLRSDLDEAALSELGARTTELARAARDGRPDLADRTWLVEAFHPSAPVLAKIAFATKTALVGEGLAVSDRVPTLAVGDLDVLLRMDPDTAHAVACRRWASNGSLRPNDALLAVVLRDPRETALHAGVCDGGTWTWLR